MTPEHRISRREMLAAAAVGAAAVYLGIERDYADRPKRFRGRVIVVGAGLAGLSAAWDLERRGWEVIVVEARRRVGGRVNTLRGFDGSQIAEAGGEYIAVTHDRMRHFCREFGLPLDDVREAEERFEGAVYVGGRRTGYERFAAAAESQIARYWEAAWLLGRDLDYADPTAQGGAALDRRTAASLADELGITGRARQILDREIRDDYAIEADRLSLLFLALETAYSWETPDSGIEAFRIRGGNDRLTRAFAGRLRQKPFTGARVSAVRETPREVFVTAGGERLRAHHLVLATALPGLRGVRFDPRPSPAIAAAIRELQYGPVTKTPLQYDQRFWRQEELSGYTLTDLPVSTTWDATDLQRGRHGILMTYQSGDAGLEAASLPTERRIAETAAQLDEAYPGSAGLLAGGRSAAWSNSPLNGGAYCAYAPGQVSGFWTALRNPHGRIQLAGEHTAGPSGYMEAAVASGLRAARRIDER